MGTEARRVPSILMPSGQCQFLSSVEMLRVWEVRKGGDKCTSIYSQGKS